MVGIGQTGSGKTLAFLIPALVHIHKAKEQNRKFIFFKRALRTFFFLPIYLPIKKYFIA